VGFLLACSKLYLSLIITHWLSFALFKDVFFQLQRLYNIYEIMSRAYKDTN
jgi:hypothetical protein